MIFHTLEKLKKIKEIDFIHISTDSKKIKKIVENKKFKINFLRNRNLAKDITPTYKVLIEDYYQISKIKKKNYDMIISVSACNPFLDEKDIIKAIKLFKKNKGKFQILCVSKYNSVIERSFKINSGILSYNNKKNILKRSQDFSNSYYDNDSFMITNINLLKNYHKSKFIPYIIPSYRGIDINNPEDLVFAKKLIN